MYKMDCKKGLGFKIVRFNGNIAELSSLKGHGVFLLDKKYGDTFDEQPDEIILTRYYKELGCITPNMEVVSQTSGSGIEIGDVIFHDPDRCAEGIHRYEDISG